MYYTPELHHALLYNNALKNKIYFLINQLSMFLYQQFLDYKPDIFSKYQHIETKFNHVP